MNTLRVILVVKCILEEENKILFLKEPPGNSWRPGSWSLPGGKIEKDETYIDAVHREVKEETGLKVKIKGLLRIQEIIRHIGDDVRLVHHYVFVVRKISGKLKKPDHYTAGFRWFSKNEIMKLPIEKLSEYYYKDAVKDYFANKEKLIDLSVIHNLNTNTNKKFKEWSSL